MHELSIAESIVKIVRSEIEKRKITAVIDKVVVKAGRMNAIIPASLEFHFDQMKKSTPLLTEAALEIVELPLHARCPACQHEQELEQPIFLCDLCGEHLDPVDAKGGRELYVDSISVRDDVSASDGAESG